ncbi:transcriptional regulator, XRE family with cupin sensor [Rathayibacter oskolensis]|uniref:Transcriptional regulator, XRE family with cupin sensor n=1 Tax=Rathayibacter oskolensis TaxID=1891671 RepID=A0A1X7PDV0_9MICO|nr:helix-turn-helix domain-containing protein [Rathayibacter oskolensis]SMH48597.1 transcriptional regulator, XRE family with cupin sensor [Rathayibacter oskolensis]
MTEETEQPPALAADIGALVHALRQARGLSMRVLAASAGVSQPFLSKLENGKLLPSLSTLYALAAALEVPPAELVPAVASSDDTTPEEHLRASDAPNAPRARLVVGGPGRTTEAYLFTTRPGESDDVDFAHPGEEFVFVIEGTAVLSYADGPHRSVSAGESVTIDTERPHRWSVPADAAGAARYLLVTTHSA